MQTVQKIAAALPEVPDRPDLEAELRKLRGQIEDMAAELASGGRAQARRASKAATAGIDGIGRELRHVEKQALATVRGHPVESIALALGVGVLVALLFRR